MIPDTVTSLGRNAFSGCTGLETLVLGAGTESIPEGVFSGCTSLKTVTIPDTVYNIYDDAFKGCTSITDVYYLGSQEDWNNIYFGRENQSIRKAKIHYNVQDVTAPVIDSDKAKEQGGNVYTAPEMKASELLKLAGDGAKLTKADGTALKADDLVGTGMVLTKADGTKETVVVKGDYNGDGLITTADARMALRTAIGLETPNTAQKKACLVAGGEEIGTGDARMILRAAIGLDTLALV
jgi:hypothetical protein